MQSVEFSKLNKSLMQRHKPLKSISIVLELICIICLYIVYACICNPFWATAVQDLYVDTRYNCFHKHNAGYSNVQIRVCNMSQSMYMFKSRFLDISYEHTMTVYTQIMYIRTPRFPQRFHRYSTLCAGWRICYDLGFFSRITLVCKRKPTIQCSLGYRCCGALHNIVPVTTARSSTLVQTTRFRNHDNGLSALSDGMYVNTRTGQWVTPIVVDVNTGTLTTGSDQTSVNTTTVGSPTGSGVWALIAILVVDVNIGTMTTGSDQLSVNTSAVEASTGSGVCALTVSMDKGLRLLNNAQIMRYLPTHMHVNRIYVVYICCLKYIGFGIKSYELVGQDVDYFVCHTIVWWLYITSGKPMLYAAVYEITDVVSMWYLQSYMKIFSGLVLRWMYVLIRIDTEYVSLSVLNPVSTVQLLSACECEHESNVVHGSIAQLMVLSTSHNKRENYMSVICESMGYYTNPNMNTVITSLSCISPSTQCQFVGIFVYKRSQIYIVGPGILIVMRPKKTEHGACTL